MTYNRPPRFTILHFAQRFLIDGETLMIPYSFVIIATGKPKLLLYAACPFLSRFIPHPTK